MKRNDLVKKLAAAEKEMVELMEKRKSLRESILGYKMVLEMVDNGQLDILDPPATK